VRFADLIGRPIPTIIETSFTQAANKFDNALSLIRPFRNTGEEYHETNLIGNFACAFSAQGGVPFFETPLGDQERLDGFFLNQGTAFKVEAKHLHGGTLSELTEDVDRLTAIPAAHLIQEYRGDPNHLIDAYDVLICDCWKEEIAQW